jgi:hypothetical protein
MTAQCLGFGQALAYDMEGLKLVIWATIPPLSKMILMTIIEILCFVFAYYGILCTFKGESIV